MSSNICKITLTFSANRFFAILLSVILLTSVAAMGMIPAEATRSEANHKLEINSDLVCGVEICSTPMTIQEKINAFQHETISAPTIIQQSIQQLAPKDLRKDMSSFKQLLKSDIKQMIGSKIQAAKDIKQFSKSDLKINKDKFSAKSLKQFNSLESSITDKKLLKPFSDLSTQKIKIKKTLDARQLIDVKSILTKQKLDIGDKPILIKNKLTPKQIQKDIDVIKFKGEENKIPMKIVKELKLKVPKIVTKIQEVTVLTAEQKQILENITLEEITDLLLRFDITIQEDSTNIDRELETLVAIINSKSDAELQRILGELEMEQMEAESEIIKLIMESKNATVDAVMKMMKAMFATQQKLMSAGMAR